MINFIFFFLEFPRGCFSVTLYEQRFTSETTYANGASDNCLFPNRTFTFNTIYNFTLNNCKKKTCYAIIDKTFDMKWGNTEDIFPSAFSSVNITGATYLHKYAGVVFKPTQSTINIRLQTQTCHDFYTIHPFETVENCNMTLPISDIIRGLPLCNDIN